jgi:hypothetical protein
MMKKLRFLGAFAALALILTVFEGYDTAESKKMETQSEKMEKWRTYVEIDVRRVRQWLQKFAAPDVRLLDSRVRFVAEASIVPFAAAFNGNGSQPPTIRISSNLLYILTRLADNRYILGQDPKYAPCGSLYEQHIFEVFAENSVRREQNLPFRNIDPPDVFYETSGPTCQELANFFPIPDKKITDILDDGVLNAVGIIYFHELAHIYYGHTSETSNSLFDESVNDEVRWDALVSSNGGSEESRSREIQADLWAIDQLIDSGMGVVPIITAPLLNFLISATGLDCQFESKSSHPFGLKRWNAMMRRLEQRFLRKYQKSLPQELHLLIQDINTLSEKTINVMNCPR